MAKKDLYTVEGDGVFMADHGDRYACGKCGYTEMKNKD